MFVFQIPPMRVRIKKLHPAAVIPRYAKNSDAGLDLVAVSEKRNTEERCWEYGTGLAIEIPEGYVGLIFPRSSICKQDLLLTNHVGVIDSGYRGEIRFKFKELEHSGQRYYKNDKIGQLIIVPYPQITFEEVNELSTTERGTGGFGSTGR